MKATMMIGIAVVLLSGSAVAQSLPQPAGDTLRLEVGSTEVHGRVFAPHAARVRVYVGEEHAGASDLIPVAVGLKKGLVMIAPFWRPGMTASEARIFSVLDKTLVSVEGADVSAWKVEEYRAGDRRLLATWYLLEDSPYMVYGEVVLPNGQIQRMSEVAIPLR
jgi:hypothetical protein